MRHKLLPLLILAATLLFCTSVSVAESSQDRQQAKARHLVLFVASGLGPHQLDLFKAVADAEGISSSFEQMQQPIEVKPEILGATLPDRYSAGSTLATGKPSLAFQLSVDVEGKPVPTLLERGIQQGYSFGLVTSGALSESALAAFAVHASGEVSPGAVAKQIVEARPQVLVGGDKMVFQSTGDPSLLSVLRDEGYSIVHNREELENFQGTHLAGFFEHQFAIDVEEYPDEPMLGEIVLQAMNILTRNPRGSILVVETTSLDTACRQGDIVGIVHELKRLNRAVAVALVQAESRKDMLVAVISPYETGNFLMIKDQMPVFLNKYPDIKCSPGYADRQIGQSNDVGHVLLSLQQHSGIPFLEQHALADVCRSPAGEERAKIIGKIFTYHSTGGTFIQDRPSARSTPGFVHGPGAADWPENLSLAETGLLLRKSLGLSSP
jgi:alkaline phosphatase